MKSFVLLALAVMLAFLTAPLLQSSEVSLASVSPAELAAAFGRDDTEGLCCSLDTGGACADPDTTPWESGCNCSGVGCCSCTNTGAQCFKRTSTVAVHDECIEPTGDPTDHQCGLVSVTPCYTYKHGVCDDDAGGFNPFWFCDMCGCDVTGQPTKLFGTVKACTGTSTGC